MTKTAVNISLIKQAVLAAEANARQSTSHTKTRGNVRGGGRKPWKQKGTGNARAGSRRSPIWVGGGITFGPQKERTYKQNMSKKMAQAAFKELLNYLFAEGQLRVSDKLTLKSTKTKDAVALLKSYELGTKNTLLVTENLEAELVLASRNIPNITVVENKNLSILQLSRAVVVLMEKAAAESRGLVKTATAVKKATAPKTIKKAEQK